MKAIDRHPWFAIVCLLASLFVLHLCTISHQSYFIDEVEELHFAQGDFWKSVFMPDSMPPTYTVSLRIWLTLFGESVDARWLSASLGMLSTLAIYGFVWSLSNPRVALISASFFAFSPLQLYYAQLIRGYALMTCLSVFCIGFFLLAMSSSKHRDFAAYTILSVMGMYVHYYFAMIPIALLIAWLIQRRFEQLASMATCYFAMFLLTCPVLIFLIEDFKYQHNLRDPRPMSLSAVVYTYFSYFSGYAIGPSQRELQYIDSKAAMRLAVPWLVVVAATAGPLAIRGLVSLKRKKLLASLACVLTVPLILIGFAGLLSGITYNVRFVAWFAFPMSVLFAFAFMSDNERKQPKWVWVCGVALLGIFCVANFNRLFISRYQFEDSRAAAKFLLENRTSDEAVYVVSDYMLQPLVHYFDGGSQGLFELPQPGTRSRVIRDAESYAEAMNVVGTHSLDKRSWLVYSRPFHGDPKGMILQEFERRGALLSGRFAGIDLYLIPASSGVE
jgi:4-amino-4-deoxy-L-arabinose transferase-like glycosyltransferase